MSGGQGEATGDRRPEAVPPLDPLEAAFEGVPLKQVLDLEGEPDGRGRNDRSGAAAAKCSLEWEARQWWGQCPLVKRAEAIKLVLFPEGIEPRPTLFLLFRNGRSSPASALRHKKLAHVRVIIAMPTYSILPDVARDDLRHCCGAGWYFRSSNRGPAKR